MISVLATHYPSHLVYFNFSTRSPNINIPEYNISKVQPYSEYR